jgi:hypothetical protein
MDRKGFDLTGKTRMEKQASRKQDLQKKSFDRGSRTNGDSIAVDPKP